MILAKASLEGESHKEIFLGNQDACTCFEIQGWACGAVADGVTLTSRYTYSNAQIASRFCTDFIQTWLSARLDAYTSLQQAGDILQEGFHACTTALAAFLAEKEIPLYDCQTTLLVLLYYQGQAVWGLAGDGGILLTRNDGSFQLVISRLKTDSTVRSISDRAGWVFGSSDNTKNPIQSVILATDGLFDKLIHAVAGKVYIQQELYTALIQAGKAENPDAALEQILIEQSKIPSPYADDQSVVLMEEDTLPENVND